MNGLFRLDYRVEIALSVLAAGFLVSLAFDLERLGTLRLVAVVLLVGSLCAHTLLLRRQVRQLGRYIAGVAAASGGRSAATSASVRALHLKLPPARVLGRALAIPRIAIAVRQGRSSR